MTDWDALDWVRATDDPDPEAECIEIAEGEGDLVHLRQNTDPANVVTTTRAKWDAFVLGVRNNEFDHFVEDVPAPGAVPGEVPGRTPVRDPGGPAAEPPAPL